MSVLLVGLLGSMGACSGARVSIQREVLTLDSDQLAERVRLGHLGAYAELPDAQRRLREAASLAAELHNNDEAAGFTREQLDLARGQLLIVRLRGGGEQSFDAALSELDTAAKFAVDMGDALSDAQLVVEAAQFLAEPARARKAVGRALVFAHEADLSWGYARLWQVFEDDAEALSALQRLRWRGYRASGLPTGVPRLAPESLAAAGAPANDLVWTEINRAATAARGPDLRRWVDAALSADAHDFHALAIAVILDALDDGELSEDEALLPDLAANSADPFGGHARMLQRQRARPESLALALYRAQLMLARGIFGDAGELLEALSLDGATAHERSLHAELRALVALESGTAPGRASFSSWRRRAHAQRSHAVATWVSDYEQEQAPEGHIELAHAADRELVSGHEGRATPRLSGAVLWSAAVDKNSTKHARELAFAGIAGRDPDRAARLAICRERKLYDDDCRDLLTELNKLDYANAEYIAGLDALGGAANVRASWFTQVPWLEAEDLPSVRERLIDYEGTRVSATTDYQAAALFAELAANRPDLARARLEAYGAVLRPETRAISSMALRDLEDGLVEPREMPNLLLELPSADVDANWFLERWLPGDVETVAELFPGRSRLARFARGLALARMGAWQHATAELTAIVDELEGPGKAAVAGRLALAAHLSNQGDLRERALAVAEAETPNAFMPVYVRAKVKEDALDYAAAHELYLDALARRPRAMPAFEGALRTLALGKRDLDRVRDALLLYPDRSVHWRASELLEVAARDPEALDGMLLTNLWLARDDPATLLSIGEPAAKVAPLAELGLERLLEELQAAPDPAAAFPIAAKVLAWLGAMPSELRVDYREVELWLTFLVGRDEELMTLAAAQPRYGGFYAPPAITHPSLLLVQARKQRAVDDLLAWAIVSEELWSADDPATRSIISSLYAPVDNADLAQYACLRWFQRDELDIAAERCIPLWEELGGSPYLAVDLAYLVLNDPELARAHGLDFGEFFATAETFGELAIDPVWLLNASLWASKLGDDERGAELRVRQLALDSIAEEPDPIELGQGRYRGALIRQQIVAQFDPVDRRRFALAAGAAVRSLDLLAADLYARRLLAWLPPLAEDDRAPEFTARSPQLLEATRAEGDTSDQDLRSSGLYVLAITDMIRADLEAERMPEAAMLALFDTYAEEQGGVAELERFVADHPASHTAKLLLLAQYGETHVRKEALPLARELIGLDPHNPLVLANALPLLTEVDDLPEAKRLLAEARKLFPGHPWLSDDALPAMLTGAEEGIDGWLRRPEAFDERLATLSDTTLDALAPARAANVEISAELFFPAEMEPSEEGLSARQDIPGFVPGPEDADAMIQSRALFLIREPRASRCEGLDCAQPVIADWQARGFALLWSRELQIPAGEAIEFLISDGESIIDCVMLPTGGNVFVLLAGTRLEDMEAFLPAVKLLRESFRPLDWSLSARAAETLRGSGGKAPADALRLASRRALARAESEQTGCLLAGVPAAAELTPAARAELLLDLFLITRESWQRRRILACTSPEAPEAGRLALLALLDDDAGVHRFGREATQQHHGQVLTDTRRILYDTLEPAISDPALTLGNELPVHGLLQVIAALPDQQARELTLALLGRRDPRLRAIALAAGGTMDYFGGVSAPAQGAVSRTELERLRAVVREGETSDALLAARSLMDIPGAENLAALRDRADALAKAGIADSAARGLAVDLAWGLGRWLEAQDQRRMLAMAKAVDQDPADDETSAAENTREALEDMAKDHATARKLASKRNPSFDSERVARWVRGKAKPSAPRSAEQLREAPLAELTPGDAWTFVRVANAGLFATNLESLLQRLAPAEAADAYLVRALIHETLLQGSFALLREGGGLDLSAPIECVSPKDSSTFACSATLSDPDAALSILARRELGDDAGIALPMDLATEFAGLPVMLGMLPVALHSLVEAPEDELDPNDSIEIASERLRRTRTVAGHELEYYATVELHDDHMVVDSEHYMILGDRLLVFSSVGVAEQLLRETPSGTNTLAEAPHFAETRASWRDGVALQAVDFTEELGLPQMSLEVVLDNEGMVFNARGHGDRQAIGDFAELGRLLPQAPVASAAVALEPDALRDYFEDSEVLRCRGYGSAPAATSDTEAAPATGDDSCGLTPGDKFPPVELAESASAALLGWYPEAGDSLWQDWVLIMPLDRKLRAAAKRLRIPLPAPGESLEHAGLTWAVRDDALAVASTPELGAALLSQPALPPLEERAPTFASFSLDGQRAAEVVRGLAERYEGEQRQNYLRVIATVIGLVEGVELRGEWVADGANLSATIALNLAESEEELALINRWLASPEVSNASKLPRRLAGSELDGGLVYTLKVEHAEQFARNAIPTDNPRISVEVTGENELRLTVLPSRAVSSQAAAPLTPDEREDELESDSMIRAEDPELRELANELRVSGNDTATVAAVVTWVHKHVHYEITPTSLDARKIFERATGDCTEYALLTVTLLRAAGIPARLQEGMAASGDEMVAHAWVAWHDGTRWREVDPTAGTASVSAGHLELEVIDVLAMISLGQFEVTAITRLDP